MNCACNVYVQNDEMRWDDRLEWRDGLCYQFRGSADNIISSSPIQIDSHRVYVTFECNVAASVQ